MTDRTDTHVKSSRLHRVARIAGTAGVLACFAIALAVLLPSLLGMQRYVITGGSMTGSYDRGSIVYEKSVPVAQLQVGDVITYKPPAGSVTQGLVTHRIVWIGRDHDGARSFRTKGDHNAVADPWRFTLPDANQARVVFHIPYVGYVLAALGVRQLRMLLIGLPALAFGLLAFVRLWRNEDEEPAVAAAGQAPA
jgi:signal peptidase